MIDLTGKRFNRLLVQKFAGTHRFPSGGIGHRWECVCDCGGKATPLYSSLQNGDCGSCGCLHSEIIKAVHTKHGKSKTSIYRTWQAIWQRCTNPKNGFYKNYGARGIRVCKRWSNFNVFLSDVGNRPDGLTLERINNNGDYKPSNCRWVTHREQQWNKTVSHLLTYQGRTQCLAAWCEELGLQYNCIHPRVYRLGWSTKDALTIPVKPKGGNLER